MKVFDQNSFWKCFKISSDNREIFETMFNDSTNIYKFKSLAYFEGKENRWALDYLVQCKCFDSSKYENFEIIKRRLCESANSLKPLLYSDGIKLDNRFIAMHLPTYFEKSAKRMHLYHLKNLTKRYCG